MAHYIKPTIEIVEMESAVDVVAGIGLSNSVGYEENLVKSGYSETFDDADPMYFSVPKDVNIWEPSEEWDDER